MAPSEVRTLPDRLADELIARIFTGQLVPGESLPAERVLAAQLGVDRTSLRIALRQLTRMRLTRTVRGSGVTVLDYRQHAGIDFLAAVLDVPGLELGGAFMLEALDHWDDAMPHIVATAFARATPGTIAEIDDLFGEQLRLLELPGQGARDEVVEVELDVHDRIVAMAGDVTLRLIANSTRPLRRQLTRLQIDLVDMREQVAGQRAQLRAVLAGGEQIDALRAAHGQSMKRMHRRLHAHIATLPPAPWRTTKWDPTRAHASGDER